MKASSVQVSKYFPHRKLRRTKVIFFIILRGNLQGGKQKCTLYNTIEINEYWKHILQDKHMKASSVQVSKYFPHRKLRRTKVLFFITLIGNIHEGANKNVLSTTQLKRMKILKTYITKTNI